VPFKSSAVHAANFEATSRAVRQALPNSFELENTGTGEVQLYVSVPDGMSYGQGALLLRSYLAGRSLRWALAGDARDRSVLAEVVAVPAEPVALPFSPGWRHGAMPLETQVRDFISFVSARDTRDFVAAEREVETFWDVPKRWTHAKRVRLRRALQEQEVSFSRSVKLPGVWATELGGAWPGVAPRLSSSAARVAGLGVLHDGVRDRWARNLVEELADLVPKDEVEALMSLWVQHHHHVDEQLVARPIDGSTWMHKTVDRRYKTLRGVPERFWNLIEPRVAHAWQMLHAHATNLYLLNKDEARVTFDEVRRTAFFFARDMYQRRVRERIVPSWTFERFSGHNTSRLVGQLLADRSWLVLHRGALAGHRSRTYKLREDLWPPRRGEPVLFVPP